MHTVKLVLGISAFCFAMTAWAVVDSALKDFGTPGKKALWVAVAALPYIGFLIYFAFGFRKGKKSG